MVVQAMKKEKFTDIEYSFRKKKTKREEFLEIMDEIIPRDEWVGVSYPRLIFAFPHAFGLFDIYFVFSAGFSLPLLCSFPTQLVARILTFWYAEKYAFYTL